MSLIFYHIFAMLLLYSSIMYAATNTAYDLRSAINDDPRSRAARALVESKEAEVDGAYSAYYPTISSTGSMGDIQNDDPLLRDGQKRVLGLSIAQPIPIFGKERALVEAAQAALKAEKVNLGKVQQEIYYEILDTAFQVASLRNTMQIRGAIEKLLRNRVKALHESVRGGGARITDLGLAQSKLSQAIAYHTNAKADYNSMRAKLTSLLPNFDPQLLMTELKPERLGLQAPESVDQALLLAKQNATTIRKAQAEVERAKAEHDVSKANIWPQLTLNFQVQRGSFGEISQNSQGIFLGFNAPLFEGGSRWSASKSAAYRFTSAQEALRAELRTLEQRIRELWTRWQTLKGSVLSWERSIKEQETTLKLTREQMLGGGATKIDVSKAQEIILESKLQGVQQRLEHNRIFLQLLLEMGELNIPFVGI